MALEVMLPNAAIRNLIREGKIHQIYTQMQMGQDKYGMQTLNQALFALYKNKLVSLEEAQGRSVEPEEFRHHDRERRQEDGGTSGGTGPDGAASALVTRARRSRGSGGDRDGPAARDVDRTRNAGGADLHHVTAARDRGLPARGEGAVDPEAVARRPRDRAVLRARERRDVDDGDTCRVRGRGR